MNQGAATTVYCALAPQVENLSGGYFDSCAEGSASALAENLNGAMRLDELSFEFLQQRGFLALRQ
jgi:WW domain-containing oxidoreductase